MVRDLIKTVTKRDSIYTIGPVINENLLTKEEQFAAYGQQLFDVIINTTLRVFSNMGWLKLLAKVAVDFYQPIWQDKVYQQAKGYLAHDTTRYTAYQTIKVLASVHKEAQQTISTTPEPEFRVSWH